MRTTTVVILAATLTFCVFIFCARMRSLGCVRMRSGGCRPGLCAHEPGTVSLYHHPLGPRCLSTVLCNVHGISLRLPLWRAFWSMLFWVWLNHRVHARTEEVWSSTHYAECFIYFCIINERVFFFFNLKIHFVLFGPGDTELQLLVVIESISRSLVEFIHSNTWFLHLIFFIYLENENLSFSLSFPPSFFPTPLPCFFLPSTFFWKQGL